MATTTPVDEIAALAEQMERRLGAIREERAELSTQDQQLAGLESVVEDSLAVLRRGGTPPAAATAPAPRRRSASAGSAKRSGSRSSGGSSRASSGNRSRGGAAAPAAASSPAGTSAAKPAAKASAAPAAKRTRATKPKAARSRSTASRASAASSSLTTEQRQDQVREFLEAGPKTRKEIADELKVSPPRVQQIMSPMIDAGVLVSEPDPTTNRSRQIWRLTGNTPATAGAASDGDSA
jgi:hypothetical protein